MKPALCYIFWNQGRFQEAYCFECQLAALFTTCCLISDNCLLLVDAEMARRRGAGEVHAELCLYAFLLFLAGAGSKSDTVLNWLLV